MGSVSMDLQGFLRLYVEPVANNLPSEARGAFRHNCEERWPQILEVANRMINGSPDTKPSPEELREYFQRQVWLLTIPFLRKRRGYGSRICFGGSAAGNLSLCVFVPVQRGEDLDDALGERFRQAVEDRGLMELILAHFRRHDIDLETLWEEAGSPAPSMYKEDFNTFNTIDEMFKSLIEGLLRDEDRDDEEDGSALAR